ncbi:MarR family winged helix-turn-helix transcriptional regulator [Miltoncostaea marina]|uniref:MarR family winged helix-turn-helix transcriptional regulator n=1 Tax=Miltoncostaea marina TaxID=2843215 RepID=UPI001C3D0DC5|nr:MarR family transcriptional regulator [Miltoncostaea marina]
MNRSTTPADGEDRARLARRAIEALERVACATGRELDRHAAGYGVSDAKLEVLEVLLCARGGRACLHDLGDELGVTRPNVTKLVDGLERSGLVERRPHPSDGRMVQAHVTPAGAELADEALPGRERVMRDVWDGLDDDELARLIGLLEAVAERATAPARSR